MSTFNSTAPSVLTPFLTDRFELDLSDSIESGTNARMEDVIPVLDPPALSAAGSTADLPMFAPTPPPPFVEFFTYEPEGMGEFWFDRLHVLPRIITLGNILTTVQIQIDIYNAYLYEPHDLQAFINNAGAGTSIIDLPSLPYTIPAQRSLLLTLEVTPDGPSIINTTLDFDTDEPYLLSIPITGTRVVVFPFEPESPLRETLRFLTDVIESKDGSEQRVSLRLMPRQEFEMRLVREDGPERQRVDFLLFDWQSRVFGLPVWTEPSFLTAAVTASQTSINVDSTANADFRVGGAAIIFESESKFDALEIASIGATTINFATPVQNNYDAGIRVMPLREAITTTPARERKYAKNLAEISLTMRVIDNDVDLGSISGWPTHSGKVLLSDPNAIEQTLDGEIRREIVNFDGLAGVFSHASTWDRAKHGSAKTFITRTRAGLWSVRQLLHSFRGRQVSFFLPTFTQDISLATLYTSGAAALTIFNVGYSRYVQQRTPKVDIRIVLKTGTVFSRTITGSAEVDADTEQLTLSSVISQNIDPADVERIEFVEQVRIDTDEITIEHLNANGEAVVGFPVMGVFE